MLNISEELKQNIEDIVTQVRAVERKIAGAVSLDADQSAMIAFSCAEIALLAFAASDELKEEGEIGDRLLQREISSALWSIALHCVEVQTWQDEFTMRMNIELMGQQCAAVLRMTGIPEPVPEESLVLHVLEDIRVPDGKTKIQTLSPAGPLEPVPESKETSLAAAPPPEDQIQRLRIEIKALREILEALVLKRDNLLLVESKELESLYMKELGYLELEVYEAESNARYLKRKYEMMQAAMNRREPINTPEIEKKLEERAEEFKKVYEEFRKKAKEAEEQEAGVNRLKKLYRKIVKAMHPDLHPDQDEKTKELFKRAMAAYEKGDLQTLEEIAQIIEGEEPENAEDLLASLLKERERLRSLIQGIREQIRLIINRYPFTKKELLHDPVRLKAEQDRLKERLEHAAQRAEAYQKKIEELTKNGRPDHQTE